MACNNICKLCDKLVISDSITFLSGSLLIDIPAASLKDGEKVCIVLAQKLPATTTIYAPAYITIGGDVNKLYPLVRCNCEPVLASSLRTRYKYRTVVVTNATSASFRVIGKMPDGPDNKIPYIPS